MHSFLWYGWTTAFLKSLGKVPSVRQELIFLCKKSIKRFVNCFITFVGISLSWVAFFMLSLFTSLETSFIFDSFYYFINNRNTMMFLVFLNSFFNWIRNVRNIVEVRLVDFDSKIWYYINKESVKNIYYFVTVIYSFDLTLFENCH